MYILSMHFFYFYIVFVNAPLPSGAPTTLLYSLYNEKSILFNSILFYSI